MTLNVENTDWNLALVLKNEDQKELDKKRQEIKNKSERFVKNWKNRQDYLSDPKILKQALDEYESFFKEGCYGDEGYYLELKSYLDQNNPQIKAALNKIEDFGKQIENSLKFFPITLSKVTEQKQNEFIHFSELKEYKHFLEKLFAKSKHILSEPEEKILNLKESPAHSNWENMVKGLLSKEEREVLLEDNSKAKKAFSELPPLVESSNKKVRDIAAKAFSEILEKYEEIAENEINSILQNKRINDQLRSFDRPDKSRHLSDDIETEIVDSLVRAVSEKFYISHKFYELKAKLLGFKNLKYHERNIPYGKITEKYSYEKSVEIVHEVLKKLDIQFSEIFSNYVKNEQIDVFPKKGKYSGAFCLRGTLKQPTFILLNHNERLRDVTTLAHEVGHGINNELMKSKQNSLNFGTPKSTAEVASTFMEDFVFDVLLQNVDEERRLALLLKKLEEDIQSIFRQIAFYKFEQELHLKAKEKGYLSKEEIREIFIKNLSAQLGSYVDISEYGHWWLYVPHFRYIFYVYSYSSGLLISKALQAKVRKNPQFIKNVKEFLAAGCSDSPKNIFLKLGIDISRKEFWEEGLKEVENLLIETENLAKKLGKLK